MPKRSKIFSKINVPPEECSKCKNCMKCVDKIHLNKCLEKSNSDCICCDCCEKKCKNWQIIPGGHGRFKKYKRKVSSRKVSNRKVSNRKVSKRKIR